MKNIEKGFTAPKSGDKVDGFAEVKKEFFKTLALVFSILTTTLWFAAIWGAAVALGGLLAWTAVACPWVPAAMLKVGHLIEYLLFAVDCICFVYSVGKHVYHHVTKDSH